MFSSLDTGTSFEGTSLDSKSNHMEEERERQTDTEADTDRETERQRQREKLYYLVV